MRKGFRPSLEPSASRRVNLDGRRPLFCVVMTTAVILLITAIFGVSAWSMKQHRFGHNSFMFHAGDQVALSKVAHDDFTAKFCDGYQVTLTDQERAILLHQGAQINQSLIATSSFALHHVPSRRYSFLEVYLLEGSTLEVGACRENGSLSEDIHILLIKGTSNFHKWTITPHCSTCVLHRVTILPSVICGHDHSHRKSLLTEPEISMNVTLTDTDRYMLVVHYEQGIQDNMNDNSYYTGIEGKIGVIVSGIFNRTRYDVANFEKRCRGKGTCDFNLDWGESQDIVVDFLNPRNKVGEAGQQRTITTICDVRMAFWLLLFLGIPFLLGIPIAGVFWWFLCRKSRQPSLKRLSKQAETRVRTSEICTSDGSGLVPNDELVSRDEDGCMGIQDD